VISCTHPIVIIYTTKFWICGMSDVYVCSEMEKETCWESLKIYRILNGSFLIQILKKWVHGTTKNLEPLVSSVHYLSFKHSY